MVDLSARKPAEPIPPAAKTEQTSFGARYLYYPGGHGVTWKLYGVALTDGSQVEIRVAGPGSPIIPDNVLEGAPRNFIRKLGTILNIQRTVRVDQNTFRLGTDNREDWPEIERQIKKLLKEEFGMEDIRFG